MSCWVYRCFRGVLDSGACACTCPVGITGENYEVTPCNPYNPCINGSTCSSDIVNNAVEFDCDQVTSLTRCIVDVCGDNEFCQILTDLKYACLCNNGYFGDHCEFGPCDAVNCLNGGVETLNGVSCFCQCPARYSSASCENTTCDPNHQCLNGGTCVVQGSGFSCDCGDGFTGQFCEITPCD